MDYVFWYCFLFMRFSDLKNKKRHMWPMQMTSHAVADNLPTEQYMRRERRRLKERHIWEDLKPDWKKLSERLYTNHVTGLGWQKLHERLFLKISTKVRTLTRVKAKWDKTRWWFQQNATARFPPQLVLSPHFQQFGYLDATSQEWIACHARSIAQVWHTKQGVFRRKVLADVRDDP